MHNENSNHFMDHFVIIIKLTVQSEIFVLINSVVYLRQFYSVPLSYLSHSTALREGGQQKMASLAQQLTGLRCPPLSHSGRLSKAFSLRRNPPSPNSKRRFSVVSAVAISNAQTRERLELRKLFEEAYERCRTDPMDGVSFTVDDFTEALDKYDFNSELGTRVCERLMASLPSLFFFLHQNVNI